MSERRSMGSQSGEEMAPAVEEPGVTEAPAPPPAEIEPLIGLREFASMRQLSMPMQAALKRWMALHKHQPEGHYAGAQWQEFVTHTLAHH